MSYHNTESVQQTEMSETLPFRTLAPGLAIGEPTPSGWQSIQTLPLLILVGVTGVGKSTTLERVMESLPAALLPDRRILTDDLIIATMQAADGVVIAPVKDRKLRFEYTRRYRELHPGGMVEALAQLWVEPATLPGLLIFDGLRGDNEVIAAAQQLPAARFVMLDAPDTVRVYRLLGRSDAFDQISGAGQVATTAVLESFADLGVAEAATIFSSEDEQKLLSLVHTSQTSADDLRAKLQIVVEERRNYDPLATRTALLTQAAERALVLDTTKHTPARVAKQVIEQIRHWGMI